MPIFKARYQPPGTPPLAPTPVPLFQAGILLAVQIEVPSPLAKQLASQNQPIPQPVTGIAMVDTGATMTAVHDPVIAQLGVAAVGTANVGTAGGPQQQSLYPIRILVTPLGNLGIDYSAVIGVDLSGTGLVALLGRDFLGRTLLIYDGPNSEFTISF